MFDTIVHHVGRARPHAFAYGADMPLFTVDWHAAVFSHYAIDPHILQPHVPFQLDTRDGSAHVSLVAFTQRRMRPSLGGPVASWLITPIARHEFLNLRTYVRVNGEPGIHFIAEWIPNRLAVLLGPRTYGLPYRLGRLRYACNARARRLNGRVIARPGHAFAYEAEFSPDFAPAPPGSLDAFLLERYVAFTHHAGVTRRFQVDHAPWPQQRIDLHIVERSLLELGGAWSRHARFIGANFSSGVSDVIIGAPRVLHVHQMCAKTS